MPWFILSQYIELHAISLVLSIPTCLMCSCSSAYLCKDVRLTILLLFIAIPSMTVKSSPNGWYGCNPIIFVLANGHPFFTQVSKAFRWLWSFIAWIIFSVVMHCRMSMHISLALMFESIPGISSSLPLLWLLLDTQSSVNNCGPDLNRILMLYL